MATDWNRLDSLIGQRIRTARESQGLSQASLVSKIQEMGLEHMNAMTLSRIESGARPARATEVMAVAEALGVPDYRLTEPDEIMKYQRIHEDVAQTRTALLDAVRYFLNSRWALAHDAAGLDLPRGERIVTARAITEHPATVAEEGVWRWEHDVPPENPLPDERKQWPTEKAQILIKELFKNERPSAEEYLNALTATLATGEDGDDGEHTEAP